MADVHEHLDGRFYTVAADTYPSTPLPEKALCDEDAGLLAVGSDESLAYVVEVLRRAHEVVLAHRDGGDLLASVDFLSVAIGGCAS